MRARDGEQLVVGQRRHRIERRGDDLDFAVRVEVGERDFVARARATRSQPGRRSRAVSNARRVSARYCAPAPAAVRLIDAREKRRDDLAQLGEHLLRRRRGLRRADARTCAAAALRTPARCRRARRSTASPRAAGRAACRAPWRGSPTGRRRRSRPAISDTARGSALPSPGSSARRSRTRDRACATNSVAQRRSRRAPPGRDSSSGRRGLSVYGT